VSSTFLYSRMMFVDIADTKPKNIKPTNENPGVPSARQAKTRVLMLYLGPSPICIIKKIEMVQRRAARYICNRYHNTNSVSDMLNIINLPSLAERRLRTRLVRMYKVSFHLVAVPSDILIASDTRTRKYHPLTYRQIHTSKDTYGYSFFPYTIPQWNQLPINTLNLFHIPSENS
jgi:hypothetical protein